MKLCYGCMHELPDDVNICTYCGYDQDKIPENANFLPPGTKLQNRYILGRVLGFGGFGITYIGFDAFLERTGAELDKTVDIEVAEDILLPRMIGRRVCRQCGRPYHVVTMPPKVEGVCDACGGEVYQRADDREETVLNRFRVYQEQTSPLIEYYQKSGRLAVIDGSKTPDEVFDDICALLGE